MLFPPPPTPSSEEEGAISSDRGNSQAFLRIPPFPGRRCGPLDITGQGVAEDTDALIDALRDNRVGGAFWAAQPALHGRDIVLAPDSQRQATAMLDQAIAAGLGGRSLLIGPFASRGGIPVIARLCDPWHLARLATQICAGAGQELALVAALAGTKLTVWGTGRFARLDGSAQALRAVVEAQLLQHRIWRDPFSGDPVSARQIAALLGEWRSLIDANRPIAAIYGVARWKRVTMDALLWDGGGPVRHARRPAPAEAGTQVLAWHTRTPAAVLAELRRRGIAVGEIEDGMIRSSGLGANCVPPLSIIVDAQAAHFDPTRPSTLETMLQQGHFAPAVLERARRLRISLVEAGIGKYGNAAPPETKQRAAGPRVILVAGQVEDDRAVLLGGAGCSNRDLLARARASEPDAQIVYKPHPDVEAGHRRGAIPRAQTLQLADRIDSDTPITTLLAQVDGIHVISSLAGFEALCRAVPVTTHGVPFYAGWGLTRDLGPVQTRRSRACTLDELLAAVLILYPRYLDPLTRLPCPVEVLVERLATGHAAVTSPLVLLRKGQGRLQRLFDRFRLSG